MAVTSTSQVSSVFGTKTAEVKVEPKEVKATAAKKTTTKASTTKASTTKKTTAKKTTASEKATTKSTTAAKKTVKKELFVQYLNQQVDFDTLEKRVLDDLKVQNISASDLKLYLKPEDNACYYVANGNIAGSVNLF